MAPCGIIADLREMFVCESKLQVCALIEHLRAITNGTVRRFGYDDGCHLWESLNAAARNGSEPAAKALEECDIFIDAFHLRGHKRAMCHERFSPKSRPWASKRNTSAAEQTWRYFNKHRFSLRFCHAHSFRLHVLWIASRRNELVSTRCL